MSYKRTIYVVLLFSLWLILSGRLLYKTYFNGDTNARYISLATGLKELPSESEWMNIFHDGKKMGHTVYSIENKGKNGYGIRSSTHLNVVFGGLESEIHLENSSYMDTLFRLDSFRFWMVSDQYSTEVLGFKESTTMTLNFIQRGDTTRNQIEVPEDLYTYTAIQPMVASKGIQSGETVKVPAYDPMSMEMADVTISHEGKEWSQIGDETLFLNKLRIEFKGIPSIMWLDDNGLTYKEETIMGMTMERTTPEIALTRAQGAEVDLLNGFAVIPSHPITKPEKLKSLTIYLSGMAPDVFFALESPRQKILKTDPFQLQLTRKAQPVGRSDLSAYLQASDMIQSDHPRIIEQVSKIFKTPESPEQISKRLTRWVFQYLDKRPVASLSGAVDILETGVGDCTEHTTLFTSLSRAAGVPTKIHIGLVYLQGRFLFHAWPVVAINGEWVDVDPSLDQFPADATHLALIEGDFENLTDLIPALGNIEITILEQSY
jgi:hypothetical protein